MDSEPVQARHIAPALAGKPGRRVIDRIYAALVFAGAACDTSARRVLLEQPGVAAVEEVRVEKRWGRTRSVTARIRIHGGADAREVCRCAAQALVRQLRVADVCLVTAVATGKART